MRSQRTAIVVSLIIGLAIGVALLMVLWACAVCFSKSRTKDDERQVQEEAKRDEQAYQPETVVARPEAAKASSKPGKENFPASHEYDGKLAFKTSPAPPDNAAATPPPVVPIDTHPAAASPHPMASPDPMPTRLSNHAAAMPTPSPTHARGRPQNLSPSPGKAIETDLKLSVPESAASPTVDGAYEPRKTSPVIATVASAAVTSQGTDTEPRSHRTSSARPRSKKRPSLAELDPMVPALPQGDSKSPQPANDASADASSVDPASAHPAAVPTLNLNSITEERNKRHASTNKRSYVLEAEASGVGTTVEIDTISPVPGLPHTVSHVDRDDSLKGPTPQIPIDASEMLGEGGFAEGAVGFTVNEVPNDESQGHMRPPSAELRHAQTSAGVHPDISVSAYEDAADTRGMTAIMSDQTAVMKTGGAAQRRDLLLPNVEEGNGSTAGTGSVPVAAASDGLPPGAVVRGRDQFLDQLKSKPGDGTGSIAPDRYLHQDTTGIFASPWDNSEHSSRVGSRGGTYVPSDTTSVMSGGSGMSTWTLSSHAQQRSVRRSAFSTMPSSSRSGRWSSRASHAAPSSSGHSNWTLSGEKSNWTISGGDKSSFTMGGDQSNWTLSGNTSHFSAASRRVATRPLDDGRSEAFTMGFTEGASEWGLSPRGTARDDLDVGHSERWLQNEEIVVPSRLAPATNEKPKYTGLRQKYEQRKLRQQYAADDTTVPETALRRVDEWMGDMSGTRDEVVKRLLAQNNGDA